LAANTSSLSVLPDFNHKGDQTMNSKNVETHRAGHESWNRRDFQEMLRNSTEGFAYSDHGRNINLNGRDKFREWAEAWARAFPDGRIMNAEYIDAGDIDVATHL
jgi:hypothetical protein